MPDQRQVGETGTGRTAASEWLMGGGEMGALIRSTDWSRTPFGPRDSWPSSLRAVVNLVVGNRFPMALLWGRDLLFLYNDAYREVAAEKHPRALGRSTREIWPDVWHINEPIFAAVLDRGETVYLEDERFPIGRDGRREDAYFTFCYSPVRADDGTVAGSLVTLIETTRRVREEASLRSERNHVAATAARERELLTGVLEHVPAMITIYDPNLERFHLNAETRRVLGWTDEDANAGDLMALCYPDPSYRQEVRRLMESAKPGWHDVEVTAKDGSKVTSSWANVRLSDSTQIAIGLDLRESKRAEAELRRALADAETGRRLLDALMENLPIGLTIADAPDVRIRAVSRYGRELTGRAPETIEGISVDRHVDSWGIFRADGTPARNDDLPLTRATRKGEHVREEEWLLVRPDGTRVPILCTASPIHGSAEEIVGGVIGWQDISERKKRESALHEREERLRLIIDATGIGAFDFFPQTGRLEWSAHAKRHFGLPPEAKVDYEVFLRGLHPEDRDRVDALVKRVLGPGSTGEYATEYRTIGIEDGVERWLSARGRATFDASGKAARLVGVTQDITEQREAEEALRASEARLREAMAAPTVGVLFFSVAGAIHGANATFERMTGYGSEELRRSAHWKTLTAPEFWEASKQEAEQLAATGKAAPYEKQMVRKDGSRWWGLFAPTRLSGSGWGTECIEFVIDVTDRKRAEGALRESEERFRALVTASSQVLYRMSPDWSEMRQLSSQGLLANTERPNPHWLQDYIHPDDQAQVRSAIDEAIRTKSVFELEHRVRRADGTLGWTSSRAVPITNANGELNEWFGAAIDITDRRRAEEELKTRESDLARAQAAAHLGSWRWDLRSDVVVWSEELYRIFGVDPISFVPSNEAAHAMIHPADREMHAQSIAQALRGQTVGPFESRILRPSGEERTVEASGFEVQFDDSGEPTVLLGTILDVTARKHAEEALRERERLQRLLAETSELAARVSRVDDLVEAVGERVARELGASRCGFSEVDLDAGTVTVLKDYHGSLASIAGTFPIDKFMEHWLQEGRAGLPAVIEDIETHPRTAGLYDEAFAPLQVRAHLTVPLHRGGKWVATFWASHHEAQRWSPRDVEMMKLVAERVWSYVERNRAEEALRVANERLVETDRRKNEFLAVLSHELRNPLAPIRNSVYILEHTVPGGEQANRARQVIDRQAQHMTRLIEDLLDVTRISRGKVTLQRERVDLSAVARGTAEDHREIFARNGIELEIDVGVEPLWVDGDRTRLAQVIGNLLGNSAKFTPRGGRTTLTAEAARDGNAVLRVRDDGLGMSAETLQDLFEPFVQAAQTIERSRGGLGLGLALVKGLVEMHGGEVSASSEGLGKGSEFTVTLPLQAKARPRLSVVPAPKRTTRARRVLVVEDNADAAASLREALELADHDVEIAHSGPQGVEVARRFKPDVVLCDIGLPGLDGFGVARAIRRDPDPVLRSVYLVALSGYALQEDVEKSKQAGFDRHIAKPPSIEALEKLLHDTQPEGRHDHHAR